MVLDEITSALEKRRAELISMLENKSHGLGLERQHQIYGAINEIDLFLQTVDYYEKNGTEKDIGTIHLVRPPEPEKDMFSKLFDDLKGKIFRNR
jgi:hypothetical protein